MDELEIVKTMLAAGDTRTWSRVPAHQRVRLLGAACFLLDAQESRPARTAMQMAHRLHAAYTAYCIHASATVLRHGYTRRRRWEYTRTICRAWGDEPEAQRVMLVKAGAALFARCQKGGK